jgi:hypothetical protein
MIAAPPLLVPGEMPIARVTENRNATISACFGGARSGKSVNKLTVGSNASWSHDGLLFSGSGSGSYVTIAEDPGVAYNSPGTIIVVLRPDSYGENGFGRILANTTDSTRAIDLYLRSASTSITWKNDYVTVVGTSYNWTLTNFTMGDRYCLVLANPGVEDQTNGFICNLNTRYEQSVNAADGYLFGYRADDLGIGNRAGHDRSFDGAIELLQVIPEDLSYIGAQIARDPYMFWNAT